MSGKAWYALRAMSEREEKIKESLQNRLKLSGGDALVSRLIVPSESVTEMREGKKKVSQQKMLPGYILIETELTPEGDLPEKVWYAIMETPGISGFVGGNRLKPEPLDPFEVDRILADIDARKEKPKPKIEFGPGDKVRIREGSFENFDGTVESVDTSKWMLTVRVSIFGRDTSVELEYGKVERI